MLRKKVTDFTLELVITVYDNAVKIGLEKRVAGNSNQIRPWKSIIKEIKTIFFPFY